MAPQIEVSSPRPLGSGAEMWKPSLAPAWPRRYPRGFPPRAAAAISRRGARQSVESSSGRSRTSFLISPPRATRRSSTRNRSIREIPDAPVTRAAQNALRSPSATGSAPEIVEVEPLVGMGRHVPLDDGHQPAEAGLLATRPDPDRGLEEDPVGLRFPQNAECRKHRSAGGPGQEKRAEGKRGRRAEERQPHVGAAAGRPITLDGDDLVTPERG